MPAKFLYERISNNAGKEATVDALFDDVKINGSATIYDDFSADIIDVTKWQTYYDLARYIDNGALRLKETHIHSGHWRCFSRRLEFANPELYQDHAGTGYLSCVQ